MKRPEINPDRVRWLNDVKKKKDTLHSLRQRIDHLRKREKELIEQIKRTEGYIAEVCAKIKKLESDYFNLAGVFPTY